jgi:enoyl-CoA hydratase/carnithine racemase
MYLIAQEGPLFKHNFGVGLTIPGGGLWLAHQRGGLTAANELLLASRPMTAARAHELRLVNEVVPAQALMGRARAVAAILATTPREPLQLSRQLVAQASLTPLPDFIAADSEVLVRVSGGGAAQGLAVSCLVVHLHNL